MDELVEDLRRQIVEALSLEEVSPSDIDPGAPLFGEGMGLDSIDALELVVMIEKHYGILIEDRDVGRRALASVKAMAEFLREQQAH